MSYKNLEIWQIAREVVIDVHKMSLTKLYHQMTKQ